MARPGDMSKGEDEQEVELHALRDENDSLRQECQELRASINSHNDFINEITSIIPRSYNMDAAPETNIIHFLKDMQSIASILAKLTANYR
jgi:uncharacterized protein YlxW (UPF0749 family)